MSASSPIISLPRDGIYSSSIQHHDNWWQEESRRTRTDPSSLLRQRIRVLAWIKAGRPPLSIWPATVSEAA